MEHMERELQKFESIAGLVGYKLMSNFDRSVKYTTSECIDRARCIVAVDPGAKNPDTPALVMSKIGTALVVWVDDGKDDRQETKREVRLNAVRTSRNFEVELELTLFTFGDAA